MDWIALAETVGGLAGAPFTGGATLGLTAAGLGRFATDKAVNQETAAAAKAQGQANTLYQGTSNALNNIYQGQQKAYAPYTSLGAGAAGLLGQGLGIAVAPPPSGPIQASETGAAPGVNYAQITTPQVNKPGVTFPGIGGPGSQPFPGQPQINPTQQRASSYGGTVKMRAPDGSMSEVPAGSVGHYKQLGAEVV